jgi:hypothetical protein
VTSTGIVARWGDNFNPRADMTRGLREKFARFSPDLSIDLTGNFGFRRNISDMLCRELE